MQSKILKCKLYKTHRYFIDKSSKREFGLTFTLITDGLSDILTRNSVAFPEVKFHDRSSKSTVFFVSPILTRKLFIVIPRLTVSYVNSCS